MKAHHWANQLRDHTEKIKVLSDSINEIGQTAKRRGGSDLAVQGAIREQRDKWLVVCQLSSWAKPSMFTGMLGRFGWEFEKAARGAFLALWG